MRNTRDLAKHLKVHSKCRLLQTLGTFMIFFAMVVLLKINAYGSVTGKVDGTTQNPPHLIQTTTNKDVWESYVNLGFTRTFISEDDTLEDIKEKMKQSFVYIGPIKRCNTETWEFALGGKGSGFIIEVTDDSVYIMTNEHVTNMRYNDGEFPFYIRFADDDLHQSIVNSRRFDKKLFHYNTFAEYVGSSKINDVAIIKIDISQLDYEDREKFKAIPLPKDLNFDTDLKKGMPLYMLHIDKYFDSKYMTSSLITPTPVMSLWDLPCYLIKECVVPGDSGSCVFDERGNIIGMAMGDQDISGTWEAVIVPYEDILAAYEEIMGHPLEQKGF